MKQRSTSRSSGTVRKKWLSFAGEIWNDHDFWIKALAVKGGAGAVVIAGIMAIAHLVALPFLVAAIGIAFCGSLVAVGIYGVLLAVLTMWEKLGEIYYKIFLNKLPRKKSLHKKPLSRRLVEGPRIQALLARPFMQKILKSHAWQATQRITKKQEDLFLAGLAMKGSIISAVVGLSLVATQIMVLPVIAIGSLLTFTTIFAVSTVASGVYGVYLSARGLMKIFHTKGKKRKS